MKTLNENAIKTQLKACGVVVENISVELANIVAASVAPEHEKAFYEAKINAIRFDLAAKDGDFNPKDIQLSFSPLSRSVIVYNDTPFIVDYSHKHGVFLISMDGEDFEDVKIQEYPVIGTITI